MKVSMLLTYLYSIFTQSITKVEFTRQGRTYMYFSKTGASYAISHPPLFGSAMNLTEGARA